MATRAPNPYPYPSGYGHAVVVVDVKGWCGVVVVAALFAVVVVRAGMVDARG